MTAEFLLAAAVTVLAATMLIVTLAYWRGKLRQRDDHAGQAQESARRMQDLETRLAEVTGQLRQFGENLSARETQLSRTLDGRLDQVSHKLGQSLSETTRRTGESLRQLHERLAVIDRAQANMTALSRDILGLKDILSNKQARGAFGEQRMEAIIRDALPANFYQFQATLSNNRRPDCLVRLPGGGGQIVIDAKFPMEAFTAFENSGDEQTRQLANKRLRQDMRAHIKQISGYRIPGETNETILMFVPSELIYARLYEYFDDIIQESYRVGVIIASPNILMIMVQSMQAIARDVKMREQAGLIKDMVLKLGDDVRRLEKRAKDLDKHFDLAQRDVKMLLTSSEKIGKATSRIGSLDEADTSLPALQ